MRTILYKAGTQSGPFNRAEMDRFGRMLQVDVPGFQFDENYAKFIEDQNGGEPLQRYFKAHGEWHTVERFLNFADGGQSSDTDLLFNVHQTWNLIEDRLLPGMFPFASLPGGDYLILDHSAGNTATVSMWYHERSTEESPCLIPVADDFASFITHLQTAP